MAECSWRPTLAIAGVLILGVAGASAWYFLRDTGADTVAGPFVTVTPPAPSGVFPPPAAQARRELAGLTVARNSGSGSYQRAEFGPGWGGPGPYPTLPGGCQAKVLVLKRDLTGVRAGPCVVYSGELLDPYTGKELAYARGGRSDVTIDHVVALGAAWRAGASAWTAGRRVEFANDTSNMLAVDGGANNEKGSKTPDQWRPPRGFWCPYAERWVGVKSRYGLAVTSAEQKALGEMLARCSHN